MKICSTLLAGLCCGALSGCATLDLPWPNRVAEASLKNPVVRVLCLWEPSEGRDHNGLPCRGFAGQLLFLGNKGGQPVKVNGAVTVYQFDDLGTLEEQVLPVHQFKFDEPAWNRHLKVGSFGAAYHVFIPYMRPGLHEANCSIYLRLTPTEGQPVTSDTSRIYLKGKPRPDLAIAPLTHIPERHASLMPQVQTTTIPLDGRNTIPTYSPQDAARTDRLLQEFLENQPTENPQREPEPDVSPRSSERIRWDGQRVEVIRPEAE